MERAKESNPRPQPWQGCAQPLGPLRLHDLSQRHMKPAYDTSRSPFPCAAGAESDTGHRRDTASRYCDHLAFASGTTFPRSRSSSR